VTPTRKYLALYSAGRISVFPSNTKIGFALLGFGLCGFSFLLFCGVFVFFFPFLPLCKASLVIFFPHLNQLQQETFVGYRVFFFSLFFFLFFFFFLLNTGKT